MNPYVSFGLAMCAVVGVSLFFTAYLAVHFNRRAKADMQAALAPLADVLDGEVDIEESTANGRYVGQIAAGRAASAPDGPGRVFYTWIIDGAGGDKWTYTIRRPKDPAESLVTKFEGPENDLGRSIHGSVDGRIRPLMTEPGWMRIEYDPAPGHLRLTRPMSTRKDIPVAAAFQQQLDLLIELASMNRANQSPQA